MKQIEERLFDNRLFDNIIHSPTEVHIMSEKACQRTIYRVECIIF